MKKKVYFLLGISIFQVLIDSILLSATVKKSAPVIANLSLNNFDMGYKVLS